MIRPVAGIVLGVLLLAACGSADEAPAPPTVAPDLEISMFEWGFGPSVVEFTAGDTVTLRIRNDGGVLHEWAVLDEPIVAEPEYDAGNALILVSAVQPGSAVTIEFTVPDAGTYQFICPISGHFSQGMAGTMVAVP